jgi:nitrile hydratase accessory protein
MTVNESSGPGSARAQVEQLLGQLPHQEAIRPDGAQVAFDTAWQIRVFALAVAAHQAGQYSWQEFQQALIAAIASWEQARTGEPWRYYDRWLDALEAVLVRTDALTPAQVGERTRIVLATPRDMSHQRARREPVTVAPARS